MARTNIEEEFYAKDLASKMGIAMGIPRHQALGLCVDLWHDSQSSLKFEGTEQDIVEWCRCHDPVVAAKLIFGLLRIHLIEPIEGTDRYLIVGNEIQIESLVTRLKSAQKGAAATKAKWETIKQQKATSVSPRPPAGLTALEIEGRQQTDRQAETVKDPPKTKAVTTLNSMQCNAMQDNAIQGGDAREIGRAHV